LKALIGTIAFVNLNQMTHVNANEGSIINAVWNEDLPNSIIIDEQSSANPG